MIRSTVSVLAKLGELPSMPRSEVLVVAIDEMFQIADSDGSGTCSVGIDGP
jgi:hypothetical protein